MFLLQNINIFQFVDNSWANFNPFIDSLMNLEFERDKKKRQVFIRSYLIQRLTFETSRVQSCNYSHNDVRSLPGFIIFSISNRYVFIILTVRFLYIPTLN
jgi:hypothetical protein